MKIKLVLFIIFVLILGFIFYKIQTTETLHPDSIVALSNRNFPKQQLTIISQINSTTSIVGYLSDNLQQYALMMIPKTPSPEAGYPVVIINHGHIPPHLYKTTQDYLQTVNFFAKQGFLVLKPDYRGHDRSLGQMSGSLLSRTEYTIDVLNLLAATTSLPNINHHRIFMYGHSMGADITLRTLEVTKKVRAATLWAPAITSYPQAITYFIKDRQSTKGDYDIFNRQYPEFIRRFSINQISPIDNLDQLQTPFNIHHGTADLSVPYSWGETLATKIKSLNKSVNFYSYINDNHDISGSWTQALIRDVNFFNSFK